MLIFTFELFVEISSPISLILDGATEKVPQFIMPVNPNNIKNLSFNRQNEFLNIVYISPLHFLYSCKISTLRPVC